MVVWGLRFEGWWLGFEFWGLGLRFGGVAREEGGAVLSWRGGLRRPLRAGVPRS